MKKKKIGARLIAEIRNALNEHQLRLHWDEDSLLSMAVVILRTKDSDFRPIQKRLEKVFKSKAQQRTFLKHQKLVSLSIALPLGFALYEARMKKKKFRPKKR